MFPIDVATTDVPEQQVHHGHSFPLVIECRTPAADLASVLDWLKSQSAEWDKLASEHGAILFRGFPVVTAQDFDQFVSSFDWPNFAYEDSLSNAVRINRTPKVFTANEAPSTVAIFLHHELAQTPEYPSHLFFFCELPAESGGATPICRSDILWERLAQACPQFARDCEQKGLRYSNVMPGEVDLKSGMGRTWQSTLKSRTRDEAESRLRQIGYEWTWLPDDCLRVTTPILPAVRRLTGDRVSFFNQLIAAFQGWKDDRNDPSRAITFGDGAPLDREAVNVATRLGDELSFDIPWQRGDVALVDNFVTMHGRRTFVGPRKVLASLINKATSPDRRHR
ncbi:MAG: TauD/TfdA family dioxygenase [Planctomycetes bacterium]|nr:TauD/TfdA family dioxygenase [Planctomycetota bacterium]